MRAELALGAAACAVCVSAQAAVIYRDIPASTDGTSAAAEVFIGGQLIWRYGTFDEIPPSPFTVGSGFYMLESFPLGASMTDGTLTYSQFVKENGAGIYPDCSFANDPFVVPTVGPDARAQGVAADYYSLIGYGRYGGFASAHVDASGTLVSLTYAAIPEPAGWATMLLGMGLAGTALRRRYWIAQVPGSPTTAHGFGPVTNE